jgi:hypothetical protein
VQLLRRKSGKVFSEVVTSRRDARLISTTVYQRDAGVPEKISDERPARAGFALHFRVPSMHRRAGNHPVVCFLKSMFSFNPVEAAPEGGMAETRIHDRLRRMPPFQWSVFTLWARGQRAKCSDSCRTTVPSRRTAYKVILTHQSPRSENHHG